MLALAAILLPLLFPPFYCFFLAPVALVPLAVCSIRRSLNWRYLLAYYALGFIFFALNLYWLWPVTFGGVLALSVYLAIYTPLFAIGTNRLVVQLRLPATFAVPLVWTAVEYVRSSFIQGGFPWFMLGNCVAPVPALIQIADLFGVWGVSFFLALLNGFVVDLLRLPLMVPRRVSTALGQPQRRFNPAIGSLLVCVLVATASVLGYGLFRLSQHTTTPGPRVCVVQENIPQSQKDSSDDAHKQDIFDRHFRLSQAALADNPDLIVWPETMVPEPINRAWRELEPRYLNVEGRKFQSFAIDLDRRLAEFSDAHHVTFLVGSASWDPVDNARQNAAFEYAPGRGQLDIFYAKRHLVPFGEYVPFKESVPWLQRFLLSLTPYGADDDYSLKRGDSWQRFPVAAGNKIYEFGTPICFEDVMPYPARDMTSPANRAGDGAKADFLVNISNDGWFFPVELDQHLQACMLRAVENRIPIARSVNTGNSGFIDSNGRLVQLVRDPATGASLHAVGYATQQLQIDSRLTLYTRIGDLLPMICGITTILTLAWTYVRPRRGHQNLE